MTLRPGARASVLRSSSVSLSEEEFSPSALMFSNGSTRMAASVFPTVCAPRSPWYHASTRATTNPTASTTGTARSAPLGQP